LNRAVKQNLLVSHNGRPEILLPSAGATPSDESSGTTKVATAGPQGQESNQKEITLNLAPLNDSINKLNDRLGVLAAQAAPGVTTLVLIALLQAMIIVILVVLAQHLWRQWSVGSEPPTPPIQVNSNANSSTGNRPLSPEQRARDYSEGLIKAIFDRVEELQRLAVWQKEVLQWFMDREIENPARGDVGRELFGSNTGSREDRMDEPYERPLRGEGLIKGQNVTEDYHRLEDRRFPEDDRKFFQEIWNAQPILREARGDQYLLMPANTEDEAVMWILLGAADVRGYYPVVLAPPAYLPKMAESNSRPLLMATVGFFKMKTQTGARASVLEPAWVRREGDREIFTCIEQGMLRA
jgi:hypothetical protein